MNPSHLLLPAIALSCTASLPALATAAELDSRAQGTTDVETTASAATAPPRRATDPVAPVLDADYSTAVNRRARGVGLGWNQGLWGSGFGQSLHVDIPFGLRVGQFFGARVSGTFVHGGVDDVYDPVALGGVELFGRSPVIGGLVRVYGGGGMYFGGRVRPDITGRRYGYAGGGHMGIEAFVAPRTSFGIEVGGQGPVHSLGLDAGARVMGGVSFWFGRR